MYRRKLSLGGSEAAPWKYSDLDGSEDVGTVDKLWIVPYCTTLSYMSQCCLSVELCITIIGGTKSHFKCICGKTDRKGEQMVGGQGRLVEISTSEEARYLSASEAVWNIFQFGDVERRPSVDWLDFHLLDH